MNINELIIIVKKKIENNISCDKIDIEDKTFLHKNHQNHDNKKFHIKIIIKSDELKVKKKVESTKKIYKILENELENYIHSIQLSIN